MRAGPVIIWQQQLKISADEGVDSEGLHDAHSQQETLQIGPVKHQWLAYLGQRAPRSRLAGAPVSQPSEPMHLAAGLPVSERPPPSPRWSTARHTRKAGTRARRRSRNDWKFTRRRSHARRKDFGSRSSTCPTATCQSARSRPSRARRSGSDTLRTALKTRVVARAPNAYASKVRVTVPWLLR